MKLDPASQLASKMKSIKSSETSPTVAHDEVKVATKADVDFNHKDIDR